MYDIYVTQGFVLRSKNVSENDKKILIFSEDFGIIWVNVAGGRKETSKFRYLIQDFTELKIFLVRGKNEFRMTGGELKENLFFLFELEEIKKIKSFFILIEKMLIKNHPDEKSFIFLREAVDSFKKKEELRKIEINFLVNFLTHLGYFDQDFLRENKIDLQKITEGETKKIILKINQEMKKIAF